MAPISHYNCELLKLILVELHDIPGFSPNFSNDKPCSTQLDQVQLQMGLSWGLGVISEQMQKGFLHQKSLVGAHRSHNWNIWWVIYKLPIRQF